MAGTEPDLVYSARRDGRRRRALITLMSLVLILFFAFWYALSYYRASQARPGSQPVPCVTVTEGAVQASTTHVNVYNATKRNGLAASTARELGQRGFVIGEISNDPLNKKVTAAAQIRYGARGSVQAELVRKEVAGKVVMVKDKRADDVVDLVIGTTFTTLTPVPSASPTPRCTVTASASPSP